MEPHSLQDSECDALFLCAKRPEKIKHPFRLFRLSVLNSIHGFTSYVVIAPLDIRYALIIVRNAHYVKTIFKKPVDNAYFAKYDIKQGGATMGFIGEISGDVGKRILQVREAEKMNQEDFANKLGLTKSAISGYETGRRIPTKAVLKSIAQMFSYNENWLFRGSGDPKQFEIYEGLHAVFSHFNCSDFERDFLGKYFGMTEKDRHLFCYYMNYLFGADSRETSPENDLIHDALLELEKEHHGQGTDEETARQRAGDLYIKERQKEEKPDTSASSANGSAVG